MLESRYVKEPIMGQTGRKEQDDGGFCSQAPL